MPCIPGTFDRVLRKDGYISEELWYALTESPASSPNRQPRHRSGRAELEATPKAIISFRDLFIADLAIFIPVLVYFKRMMKKAEATTVTPMSRVTPRVGSEASNHICSV